MTSTSLYIKMTPKNLSLVDFISTSFCNTLMATTRRLLFLTLLKAFHSFNVVSFMQGKCELSYSQQQSDFQFEPKTAVLDFTGGEQWLDFPLP